MVEDHDEDGTDVYEVPKISNFEYEIEYRSKRHEKTLGSFLPQPEAQPQKEKKRETNETSQANGKKKKKLDMKTCLMLSIKKSEKEKINGF